MVAQTSEVLVEMMRSGQMLDIFLHYSQQVDDKWNLRYENQ